VREDDLQVFSITNRLMLVHNLLDGRVRVFRYEVIDTAAIQPKKGDVAK